ncbi:hypothetical protein BKA70DRAFT_769314 [Coprinopsis sp. MPI-PUGE-AT-0042]|nr:hypothetical protein BKA70DRAFT_1422202 [Coprinopsis sp. MPI-PUGE-AT-0042]KAH6912629.1 hypothetical protein BKA70DRAFT_769314 [Coprinopsis sp. MPI-PUGE-AT-0042]
MLRQLTKRSAPDKIIAKDTIKEQPDQDLNSEQQPKLLYLSLTSLSTMVNQVISIVYGNTKIVDPVVQHRFYKAIVDRETIEINNNNLGGDPLVGVRKTFVIEYKNNGNTDDNVVKRRRMLEGEKLDFNWDITNATYGASPHVWSMGAYTPAYEKLFWALDHKESVRVDNGMAGFDPAYGSGKTMEVTYTHGQNIYDTSAREGSDLKFPMRT